jgi:23S rRNA (cytosine1962-C5)-methyltransferase
MAFRSWFPSPQARKPAGFSIRPTTGHGLVRCSPKARSSCVCYAGGWGVRAALAGASRVICVDSSELALDYARRNAGRNGVAARMEFLRADVTDALRGFSGHETPRAIVLDPPAFVKRKRDLEAGAAGYQRLNESALALLPNDGFLITCSCSQHLDRDDFLRLVQRASRRPHRELQLLFEGGQSADHPIHPAMPETRYLKALFMHVRGTGD